MDRSVVFSFTPWEIEMPFGLLFFLLFLFILFFVMIDRGIQNLGWFERMHKIRQMQKARAIMLRGFGHLAARDLQGAQTAAAEVDKLWQDDAQDPFRLVFNGRLAEAEGNLDTAQNMYSELAKDKNTRLYSLRAQLRLAQIRRDQDQLQKLSQQALKLAPEDYALNAICMDAYVSLEQWKKAHQLLHKMQRHDLLSEDMLRQRQAQLYLDEAETALMSNQPGKARALAAKAIKADNSPQGWAMEIDAMIAEGNKKGAMKHLKKAWEAKPDRMLLSHWNTLAPSHDVFAHYETMLALNAQSPLTHQALVEAALRSNRIMEARAHLDVLKKHHEDSVEYAEAMALVSEKLDHNKSEARLWKSKAEALRSKPSMMPVLAATANLPDPL